MVGGSFLWLAQAAVLCPFQSYQALGFVVFGVAISTAAMIYIYYIYYYYFSPVHLRIFANPLVREVRSLSRGWPVLPREHGV